MGLTKKNFKTEPRNKPQFKIETSWDDGYALDLRLASMLKNYKLPAVFYIVVDKVGNMGYLNWDQIKDLEKQGFEIGSHTMNHPADLKVLHDEELHYEVQTSKDVLEAVLGHSVGKFCYPRGRLDERVRQFVINADYIEARGTGRTGVTEIKDKYNMPGTIHVFQREEYNGVPVAQYAKNVIDKVVSEGGYVNIWGHSKEIQENGLWDVLDEVLEYANSKL